MLNRQVEYLLKQGKGIYAKKMDQDSKMVGASLIGSLKFWRSGRDITKEQHEFEANCMILEDKFRKLTQVA